MIQFIHAPSAGTSALLQLYTTTAPWRLVRKLDSAPTDVDDGELRFFGSETGELGQVLDYEDLINGRETFYQLFAEQDGAWEPEGEPKSVTPQYLLEPLFASPDFAGLVRNRLEAAMAAEVAADLLDHPSGFIPVMTAYPREGSVRFPLVTVVLKDRHDEVRGIGDYISEQEQATAWFDSHGWLDRSVLEIAVWSLSHADRVRLRDAVQRALMHNIQIFASAGYDQLSISEHDDQDFERYSAPVFQSVFNLSALHPAVVRTEYRKIANVEVEADGERT